MKNITSLYLLLTLFGFIIFIFYVNLFINTLYKTKNYISIDAIITKVYREYSSADDFSYYVNVTFDYKDINYYNKQRISFKFNKKTGKKIKIYFNPDDPHQVRNNWEFRMSLIASILSFLFFIFVFKEYLYRKKC